MPPIYDLQNMFTPSTFKSNIQCDFFMEMFFNHEKSAIRGSTSLTLFRLWWWRLHSSGNVPVIRRQPTTDKLRLAADTIWLVSIWRKKKDLFQWCQSFTGKVGQSIKHVKASKRIEPPLPYTKIVGESMPAMTPPLVLESSAWTIKIPIHGSRKKPPFI